MPRMPRRSRPITPLVRTANIKKIAFRTWFFSGLLDVIWGEWEQKYFSENQK
jgi:hypothetical protein